MILSGRAINKIYCVEVLQHQGKKKSTNALQFCLSALEMFSFLTSAYKNQLVLQFRAAFLKGLGEGVGK